MLANKPSPRKYGISHDDWRLGQWETINSILSTEKKFSTVDANTGSGKSAMAAALGTQGNICRAITHTKSLQKQYIDDFEHGNAVYGMGNYSCDLSPFPMVMADKCRHIDNMNQCSVAQKCAYLRARTLTRESDFQVLSYAYYLLSKWTTSQPADFLFIDEAHLMPSFLIDRATLEVTWTVVKSFGFPKIPDKTNVAALDRIKLLKWLDACYHTCRDAYSFARKQKDQARMQRAQELGSRFAVVKSGYAQNEDNFFVHRHEDGITIKSLSSRAFAPMLINYDNYDKVIMASATLGNINRFKGFMGIEESNDITVENMYTPQESPVRMYKDAPTINYKNKQGAMIYQSKLMAKIISKETDGHTLIHTSSKQDAYEIASRLDTLFPHRVYTPIEKGGTEEKLAAWEAYKGQTNDSITVSWCFSTGVNAPDVHTNIVQKVPYQSLDEYGKALITKNRGLYMWNAACTVAQACGRNRRGDPEHYDLDGKQNKIVAILDNSFKRIKGFTSQHFQNSIVTM